MGKQAIKPIKQGIRAFKRPRFFKGKSGVLMMEANPYEEGSQEYKEWEFGFTKAFNWNLEDKKKQVQHGDRTRS